MWDTGRGGLFIEPIERPEKDAKDVTVTITIPIALYKVLEVLCDDVPAYTSRLLTSHVRGLIKSAEYNAKQKVNE